MMIRRNRGFKLGRKLIGVCKWAIRKRGNSFRYKKLEAQTKPKSKAFSKLCKWVRSIRTGFFKPGKPGYFLMGHEPVQVPKGHLAVYVGEGENDTRRVLVPVLFLNHPLFGKLLKEAEKIYGFDHPGWITIPCPILEFENVQTKIAAGENFRRWIHWIWK